jgi:hypothetical protein
MFTKDMAKTGLIGLFLICFIAAASDALAAYEVGSMTANVSVSTPTRWTDDLTVSWEAPTMGNGDILNGFIYKWNSSSAALSDDDFDIDTGNDGFLPAHISTAIKNGTSLSDLDSGDLVYLHIKTFYTAGTQPSYSTDVVVGPFIIDNVAPTGTVRVVDASGNDIISTMSTTVKVKLTSSPDTTRVYLNESAAVLTSVQLSYSSDAEYTFADTTPGAKTIYSWFEDAVGNISTGLVTDSVTLLSQSGLPGDVDGNGDITLDDVRMAFSFFLGGPFTQQQFDRANVYDDGDGNASVSLHDVRGVFTLFLGGNL